MKIKSNKKNLEKIFEVLNPSMDSTNAFPALTGLYFDINESVATIISSNGDISIKHQIISNDYFKIIDPGILLIPSYLLKNIIKILEGEIILENEKNILYIRNNNNIYTINCLESVNYPKIDFELFNFKKIKLNSNFIKNVIKNVSFSTLANESSNIILSGVNFNIKNNKIIATATDSLRMSQEYDDIETSEEFNITITSKNLKDLFSNIKSKEIELLIDDYKLNIIDDKTIYQTKLINLPYLNVSNIIPKSFEKKLIINKKVLSDYLNKASVILNERYNSIDLEILDDKIIITSQRKEVGATRLTLEKNNYNYTGDPLKIRINNRFLKDAINVFDNEIEILFNSNTKPFMVKEKTSYNNIQLISPLRF